MAISLVVSCIGAVVAAVGSGVLLARCFRAPRGDLIAWSVALLGLLVSLGSQALGYLVKFDGATFRAMELGGQVIAPLALTLGLCEVAAKSMGARFCARLYLPSLALVATVVLTLDQLSPKGFTRTWPDPAVYYQTLPNYVLMYAIGPVTAIVTLIAVGIVVRRSGEPGWNAVLPAQLMAGGAAILLAYPPLAQLAASRVHLHLPVHREFSLICAAAAALTWLAGTRIAAMRLDALHGTPSRRTSGGQWGSGEPDDVELAGSGPRRSGGLHRSDDGAATHGLNRVRSDGGWQDDRYDDDWGRGTPGARMPDYESADPGPATSPPATSLPATSQPTIRRLATFLPMAGPGTVARGPAPSKPMGAAGAETATGRWKSSPTPRSPTTLAGPTSSARSPSTRCSKTRSTSSTS